MELVHELTELAGVVEQRLVVGDLFVGQHARDSLAVDLARPERVGAVKLWGLAPATAVLLAAPVGAHRERPREREADLAER